MPIRYVTAVILAAALVAASFGGLDNVAATNSQNKMESEISKIETAAVSLMEDEELPPPGQEGPRRVVSLTFPDGSLGYESVRYFAITRIDQRESRISYHLESSTTHQRVVSAPIVDGRGGGQFELAGDGDGIELTLTLKPDSSGNPIVYVQIA